MFRILIIGAGAIGCFVGGRLAIAGHDVTLVGRPRFVNAVRARGLELRAVSGRPETARSVTAVTSVQEAFQLADSSFALVVLAVKSYDTETALDELAAAAVPLAPILSLQNGVGNEEAIVDRFGPGWVIAGTITAPVEVLQAGVVQVTKPKFAIGIASWPGSGRGPFLRHLQEMAASAGIPTKVYGDAPGLKWSKLLMNLVGNATSAILAEPPGVTFADPRITDLEIDALREALQVMAAASIRPLNVEKYPLGTLAPLLRFGPKGLLRSALYRIVGGARGGKMPSLFLDLEAGKSENEVGWYNGAVMHKGSQVGVETPVNRLLTEIVQRLASEPQARAPWRGNVDRLVAAYLESRSDQRNQGQRED